MWCCRGVFCGRAIAYGEGLGITPGTCFAIEIHGAKRPLGKVLCNPPVHCYHLKINLPSKRSLYMRIKDSVKIIASGRKKFSTVYSESEGVGYPSEAR